MTMDQSVPTIVALLEVLRTLGQTSIPACSNKDWKLSRRNQNISVEFVSTNRDLGTSCCGCAQDNILNLTKHKEIYSLTNTLFAKMLISDIYSGDGLI